MKEDYIEKLVQAIVEIKIEEVSEIAEEALKAGEPPLEILQKGLSEGLKIIGEKYGKGEYFLGELMMAGAMAKDILKILDPHLKALEIKGKGKVLIGTVEGDLHDIGKNIVISMLLSHGFQIHDLGVDVPAERFVEAVKNFKPDILGMSALLTTTAPKMKEVIEALRKAELRDEVKIIIGGAVVSQRFANEIGADSYAKDVVIAINEISRLVGG